MAQFSIFGKNLNASEIKELQLLVQAAGESGIEVPVLTEIGPPGPAAETEVIVVLGTNSVCTDPELESDFVKAANGPRRVIWVWPEGSEALAVPAGVEKYCYSYLAWDAEKLRKTSADDDAVCFETGSGVPVAKVDTERNLCAVEETSKEGKPKEAKLK